MLENLKSTITVAKTNSEHVLRRMAYSSALMGAVLLSGENKNAVAEDIPEPPFPGDKQTQTDVPQTTPEPELDEEEKEYDSALHALRSGDVPVAQKMYEDIFRQINAYLKQQLTTHRYAQAHIIKGRAYAELAMHLQHEDFCDNTLAVVHNLQLCSGDPQTASRTLLKKYEHEITLAFNRWLSVMNGAQTNQQDLERQLDSLQKSSKDFTPEQQAEREEEVRAGIQGTRAYMKIVEMNMGTIAIENGNARMVQQPLEECTPEELQYMADLFTLGIQKAHRAKEVQYMAHFGLGKVHLAEEKYETSAQDFLSAAKIDYFTEESFEGFLSSIQQLSPDERAPLLSHAFRQLEEEAELGILDFQEGSTPFTMAQEIMKELHTLTKTLLSTLHESEFAARSKGEKLLHSLEQMEKNLVTIHQIFPQSPEDSKQKSVAVEAEMP